MAYAALFEGRHCITAKMQVKLSHLASIDAPLIITASTIRKTRKLVEAKAAISLKDGTLIAEGTATQFVIKTSEAITKEGEA